MDSLLVRGQTATNQDIAVLVDSSGRVVFDHSSSSVRIGDGTDIALVTAAGHLQVEIASDAVGIGGGVQHAEDDAHQSGDVGTLMLVVRQDSHVDLGADGDYVPLTVDADGNLRVTTAAGSGTSAADDADFTDGTTPGTPAMGVYESTPTTVTDGDLGVVGITEDRRLKVVADLSATDNAVLDAIAASLATMDDWDESDRAKVNPIAGQAGVQGGAGSVTALTQRVVLATDDPAVALLTTIDADTGNIVTAVQLLDDIVFADDGNGFTLATSKVAAVGFIADETAPDSVDEGDIGIARMTLDRFQRVVAEQTDTVRAAGTSRAIARAAVATNTSGDTVIVTNSNGGLSLRVYQLFLLATAAVSIYFTSDAGGTVIFGGSTHKIALAANAGFVLPFSPIGWFQTSANHDVVLNLSGTVAVSGGIATAEV